MEKYVLTISGLLNVKDDAKIMEKIELYIDGEWIPLITETSSSTHKNTKVIVDGEITGQLPRLSFSTFEELKKIKAIRVTGMVLGEGKYKILHIARNTISTTFEKGVHNEYGVMINLQFFTFPLENETHIEMIKRTTKDFEKYHTTLFLDCSDSQTAELDEYNGTKFKSKTMLTRKKAEEVLEKQFPEIDYIKNNIEIDRWNYTERKMNIVISSLENTLDNSMKIKII